jgi:hypothetical protein
MLAARARTNLAERAGRGRKQGHDADDARQDAGGCFRRAGERGLKHLGGLLAHEPGQLLHHGALCRLLPEQQAGGGDHQEQHRRQRRHRIERDGSAPAQGFIVDEARHRVLQQADHGGRPVDHRRATA